jgi:hypothetical protein
MIFKKCQNVSMISAMKFLKCSNFNSSVMRSLKWPNKLKQSQNVSIIENINFFSKHKVLKLSAEICKFYRKTVEC